MCVCVCVRRVCACVLLSGGRGEGGLIGEGEGGGELRTNCSTATRRLFPCEWSDSNWWNYQSCFNSTLDFDRYVAPQTSREKKSKWLIQSTRLWSWLKSWLLKNLATFLVETDSTWLGSGLLSRLDQVYCSEEGEGKALMELLYTS